MSCSVLSSRGSSAKARAYCRARPLHRTRRRSLYQTEPGQRAKGVREGFSARLDRRDGGRREGAQDPFRNRVHAPFPWSLFSERIKAPRERRAGLPERSHPPVFARRSTSNLRSRPLFLFNLPSSVAESATPARSFDALLESVGFRDHASVDRILVNCDRPFRMSLDARLDMGRLGGRALDMARGACRGCGRGGHTRRGRTRRADHL